MIVRYSSSARADIQSIYDYIATGNPVGAAQVVAGIERSINRLLLFPLSGRSGVVPSTRELVVSRLPYIVVYTFENVDVKVIAVFHAAQDIARGG